MDKILIVEDDPAVNGMLSELLMQNGYRPVSAFCGAEALNYLSLQSFALILLDLMLPDGSGEDLLLELRKRSAAPVIVVSAKGDITGKVAVLQSGADDYMTKPFHIEEVLARIGCRLRRATPPAVFTHGDIAMDTEGKTVSVKGLVTPLTVKEYALLELLLQSPGKTFSKKLLFETVWQEQYIYSDDVINTHMSNLRGKLKAAGAKDTCIETVYGLGYKLQSLEKL